MERLCFGREGVFSEVKYERVLISEDGNAGTLMTCWFNGFPLVLLNSHLDTEAELKERQIVRIEEIFSKAKQTLSSCSPICIWGGDFNTTSEEQQFETIRSFGWKDSVYPFRDIKQPTCFGSNIAKPRGAIDHLLVQGNCKTKKTQIPQPEYCFQTPAEGCCWAVQTYGSDHVPIVVDLEFEGDSITHEFSMENPLRSNT